MGQVVIECVGLFVSLIVCCMVDRLPHAASLAVPAPHAPLPEATGLSMLHVAAMQDGEAEGFQPLPVLEIARLVASTDQFKSNCNLVLIDFLLRHGYLTPDMPGYPQLLCGLRPPDCS
jgi:hypothetical protein